MVLPDLEIDVPIAVEAAYHRAQGGNRSDRSLQAPQLASQSRD